MVSGAAADLCDKSESFDKTGPWLDQLINMPNEMKHTLAVLLLLSVISVAVLWYLSNDIIILMRTGTAAYRSIQMSIVQYGTYMYHNCKKSMINPW